MHDSRYYSRRGASLLSRVSKHRFSWPEGKGKGIGTCRDCGTKLRFVGSKREWTAPDGTIYREGSGYCMGEPPCSAGADTVAGSKGATTSVSNVRAFVDPSVTNATASGWPPAPSSPVSTVDDVVDVVTFAFASCGLPRRRFVDEKDLEGALLPAMNNVAIAYGVEIGKGVTTVPCFMPTETRTPDGVARSSKLVVALELKFLRGKRNTDGGEFHRGLGQCLAYACDPTYAASVLLAVHSAPTHHQAQGRPLNPTPAPIIVQTIPPRRIYMVNRWLPAS